MLDFVYEFSQAAYVKKTRKQLGYWALSSYREKVWLNAMCQRDKSQSDIEKQSFKKAQNNIVLTTDMIQLKVATIIIGFEASMMILGWAHRQLQVTT